MLSIKEKIKKSAATTTGLLFAHFSTVRAPEKGNDVILLDADHNMNKIQNLLLDGSKFKKYSQT